MKFVKKFLQSAIVGAGTWLGIKIIEKGIETIKDPSKRAVVKKKAKHIKDILFKKEEES